MQISGLNVPTANSETTTRCPEKLRKAATEFEALLVGQMLRSARESNDTGLDADSSEANSSIFEMAEQQFAQVLANNGGLGIARMVMVGLGNDDANR